MQRATIMLAIAVCTMSIAAVPTAAAQENCQNPIDGVEVCDSDDDPAPEYASFELGQEGLGDVTVTFEERETPWFKYRSLEAQATTAEGGPAGDNVVTVEAVCDYDDTEVPCTGVWTSAGAENGTQRSADVDAYCEGAGSGATPACAILSASGDAYAEDVVDARLFVSCGALGWIGVTPCPFDNRASASLDTPVGSASAFGGAQPLGPSVYVCEKDTFSGSICVP